ncbi:MAG: BadF/BadG/BcrA/BcrD ATPase family protein [Candidatus Nealsonbacteria bacterium]
MPLKNQDDKKNQKYVIGVDGGGTKTAAVLADLNMKILKSAESGPSNLRNVGVRNGVENIAKAIKEVLGKNKGKQILSTFIGIAAVQEEYWQKREEIKKELSRYKAISPIFKGRVIIGSDQIIAFRAENDKKDGVLLIAGTGSVAHGWCKNKESHVCGWGWLADEGSGFWMGQKVFQAVLKDLDGRGPKTLLTRLVFQKLKIKTKEDLLASIYSKAPTEIIPSFSAVCDQASKQGDEIAKKIMIEAGRELALAANAAIKKLNLKNKHFPLVLAGGVFKSEIVFNIIEKEIKKFAPEVCFIRLKKRPVVGAVKLALGQIQ